MPKRPRKRNRPAGKRPTQPSALALTAEYRPGWLADSDKRRGEVRSVLSAREALVTDLGGREGLSVQRQMIVDRVVFLSLRLMALERTALTGKDIDWSHYAFLSNVLTGHLKTLGLERVAKNLGQLKDYIEGAS